MTPFSGRAGRETRNEIVHDPRPDVHDDSRLWERVLARAATLGDHVYHDEPDMPLGHTAYCARVAGADCDCPTAPAGCASWPPNQRRQRMHSATESSRR